MSKEIFPFDYRSWFGLGHVYSLQEDRPSAIYCFSKAKELRPEDPRMWTALGSVLEANAQGDISNPETLLQGNSTNAYLTALLVGMSMGMTQFGLGTKCRPYFSPNSSRIEFSEDIGEIFKLWEVSLPGIYEARLEAAGALADLCLNIKGSNTEKMEHFPLSLLKCFVDGKLFLDNNRKCHQVNFVNHGF